MEKDGFMVGCADCCIESHDKMGNFEVVVPVADKRTGLSGIARLQCAVSPDFHEVNLASWSDDDNDPIPVDDQLEQRLSSVLQTIADNRVCGNQRICPLEVVRLVEKYSKN